MGVRMREDMEAGGPVRLSEVEEAQSAMVMTAKDLADKGEIVIGGGSGDDELVS
jgi:flagellar motor switch protein FliG